MNSSLFDTWAEKYEEDILKLQNQYPFTGYFEIIDKVVSVLHSNNCKSILDLGVGSGYMLNKILIEIALEYIGIDFSEKMLAIARSKMIPHNFIQCDIATHVPNEIATRKFDCILSAFTLHHFDTDEKLKIIHQYSKLLFKRGVFIIADISFDSIEIMNEVKMTEGDKWDSEEENGYIISDDFIEILRNSNYQVTHQKVSFCNSVFVIQNKVSYP